MKARVRETPMFRLDRRLQRSVFASLLVFVAGGTAALSSAVAHVHHDADGSSVSWYPSDCCHDGDCHPVSRIQNLPAGLLMTTEDGTTLLVSSLKARRPSHDSRWHICFGSHEVHDVLCIFEPASS
jgi:hypothetical protein